MFFGEECDARNAGNRRTDTVTRMENPEHLDTGCGVRVPAHAMSWQFDCGGGPGGQHRNKTSTRVRLAIDVDLLEGDPGTVARIRRMLGARLVVTEGSSRSQWRNRVVVLERAAGRIDAAARPEPERRRSRPGRNARERRLQEKRAVAERKSARRSVSRTRFDD